MTAAIARPRILALAAVALGALAVAVPLRAGGPDNAYTVTVLQSNASDSSLVNGWGLVAGPSTPWWVSDNGQDVSTLYRADGSKVPLTVGVDSAPTGVVFNTSGAGFPVQTQTTTGTVTAPAT